MKALPLACIIALLVIPLVLADLGCIQPVGNLFVQLSSVPIAPYVGEQATMLISFGDANGLLSDNITATVLIKQEDDSVVLEKVFTTDNGVVSLKPVFNKAGNYHVSVDFQREREGDKLYQPDDFDVEVKSSEYPVGLLISTFLFGILVGYVFYKTALLTRIFVRKKKDTQSIPIKDAQVRSKKKRM